MDSENLIYELVFIKLFNIVLVQVPRIVYQVIFLYTEKSQIGFVLSEIMFRNTKIYYACSDEKDNLAIHMYVYDFGDVTKKTSGKQN